MILNLELFHFGHNNRIKMNETMIKKLAAGEIAVENNGTLEQLREVVKAAFPEDKKPDGSFKYYQKLIHNDRLWRCVDNTILPSHPISDFYTEDQHEFVRGEVVEVTRDEIAAWKGCKPEQIVIV